MKRIIYACIAVACLATTVSCGKDSDNIKVSDDGKAEVRFVIESDMKMSGSTRANGVIEKSGYRLHAFRRNPNNGDFRFYKEIELNGMEYSDNRLTGHLRLDAGTYKFVPSYGLTGSYYNWLSIADGAVLGNDIYITHTPSVPVPEIFQEHTPIDQLEEWEITLDGQQTQTISTTMHRSVGRVDVIFIGADRVNGELIPVPSKNPLGGYGTESLVFGFSEVSPRINLAGEIPDGDQLQEHTFTHGQPRTGAIMGVGPYKGSVLDDYLQFDDITPEKVPAGGAYFIGPYLFPQYGEENVVNASLTISNGNPASIRTITVADPIPLEQNKVTIIVVWVLSDNIYSADFRFIAIVDPKWDGSHIVDGSFIEEE